MVKKALYSSKGLTPKQKEIRELAMKDLKAFVALVAPQRMLGHCHKRMLDFFMKNDSERQLVLWPRAHQKSAMIAFWTLWHIVNNPHTTVLYVSDSARLAEMQLSFMKTIMNTDVFRKYWPDLCHEDEGKREVWRNNAISVDHWYRKDQLIRDFTVLACGMGANITGSHFDVVVLDDIVVYDNSATPEERSKCETWYSLLSSILNPGGFIKAVGTRYHPKDLYQKFMDTEIDTFDDFGNKNGSYQAWTVSQEVVEVDGHFLWPRTQRGDGAWFGFNWAELNKKKADYMNKLQFFAQYYNNPNDPEDAPISNFNYYDGDRLLPKYDGWYYRDDNGVDRKLNVYAAIDFASTMTQKADFTCIVVVGVDYQGNILVLDIDRFKSDKISVMHEHLSKMYSKWQWIKLRGEATGAQNLVVEHLKEMNRKKGIFYSVESDKPTQNKELRILTNLEPRYAAGIIFHRQGGNWEILEEELSQARPRHDDIKDALASVVAIITSPTRRTKAANVMELPVNSKFGGIAWQ